MSEALHRRDPQASGKSARRRRCIAALLESSQRRFAGAPPEAADPMQRPETAAAMPVTREALLGLAHFHSRTLRRSSPALCQRRSKRTPDRSDWQPHARRLRGQTPPRKSTYAVPDRSRFFDRDELLAELPTPALAEATRSAGSPIRPRNLAAAFEYVGWSRDRKHRRQPSWDGSPTLLGKNYSRRGVDQLVPEAHYTPAS